MNNSVRPRDAASLVLICREGERIFVLMGRRPRAMAFAPDIFVFPGGKLDANDKTISPVTPLHKTTLSRLTTSTTSASLATALAITATRETYEETGLVVSKTGVGYTTASHQESWPPHDYPPFLDRFGILARAITPTSSPVRFHARFFSIMVQSGATQIKPRSNGELLDLDWWPLEKARTLPLFDVTEYVLSLVAQGRTGFDTGPVPLCHYKNDRLLIHNR
ncbi:MAG: hypothetical protein V6Z81_05760 [Parvularculales bacterium]